MFHVKQDRFDVVVVGGGHAGCEAIFAAFRMGAKVALVTHRFDRIGEMSCNPAIGGLGKGHLVREIDALDGVMGRVADKAGIQFRLLNRSKGAAVQGPRAQEDRDIFRRSMQAEFKSNPEIEIVEGAVDDLLIDSGRVNGVRLADGSEVASSTVVLTAGTFLRGVIHIGGEKRPGGRVNDAPANLLGRRIEALGLPTGRLKTGTPPRLDGRTIDWDLVEMQPGDDDPELFSFLSGRVDLRQVSCGISHTNQETHDIVRLNLQESAIYGGHTDSLGPRYCPSLEDKVVKFAEKTSHQVFLEPEGLNTHIIYPNGLSTSLSADTQERFVRTLAGLGSAKIVQPGYAIEYDFVDSRCLTHSLAVRDLSGLYLAGQINGTTGYEEAAAQGLMAGLNAAAESQDGEPVILDRATAYIGVMIDDLVTRGVSEPYRMFSSRAEHRLSLRADNADARLTPIGKGLGVVSDYRWKSFFRKMEKLKVVEGSLTSLALTPTEANGLDIKVKLDGRSRTVLDLLGSGSLTRDRLKSIWPKLKGLDDSIVELAVNNAKYAPYVERQKNSVDLLRREENMSLSSDLDYGSIPGLSRELADKLTKVQPRTIAQAGRIDGMTPSGLLLVISQNRKLEG
ncbi:tRNA uridine-5-carboxymethylaminomethyl(34) synthesis enzyme MnmG [Halovulum sp. GXIMD14793]